MTHRRSRWAGDGERGSISAWLALGSVVMILCAGLAVDLGGRVHALQRAQDVAAQAARAGGQQVVASAAIQGRALTVDPGAAVAGAEEYLAAKDATGAVTATDTTVTVSVTDTYRTVFLGIIGIDALEVTSTASARLVRTLGGDER
ncbi:pilus assembly protein TadG-related protein [Georgenia thermotolerans]|uniref:Pilus assembly protein n=1 Tax=Georgenia thermotolerans TaxID=527326 RepID=A0A7J5USI7_9MICO|nr:pilus assembly protein TadG-related protein [Georgenia thermotolerans]KAE8765366.1 pilus assembly protein [Georgenia thermotolerans]